MAHFYSQPGQNFITSISNSQGEEMIDPTHRSLQRPQHNNSISMQLKHK